MKLENRERVDGTRVTIGHRVYRSNGAIKVSKRYSAEYRDPAITQRSLLDRLKALCAVCGFDNPSQYKLHSFRHHFASLCANHGVAHRKALAWLGHSSSEMLDLYYHLHDDDSRQTMMELARSNGDSPEDNESSREGSLRATGQSKTVGSPQDPDIQELVNCLQNEPERVGFEPTVG